jgi:hypothetical protein
MNTLVPLMLVPFAATAGTSFDMTARDLTHPGAAPYVTRHFVENGQSRIDMADGVVALFKDQSIITLDPKTHTVRINSEATRDRTLARMAAQLDALRGKAATLPGDQRAKMEAGATFMQSFQLETYRTIPREYTVTPRSEVAGGHECRIWTETEKGAKRLELCVVRFDVIPGGDEILAGMKTLSEYPAFGSLLALGVQFGYGEWWSGISGLEGLPILVREFEQGRPTSEFSINNVHQGVPVGGLLDIPKDYQPQEGSKGMPTMP